MTELTRRGLALYDGKIKALLEPDHNNVFVAIHVDSEGYSVSKSSGDAMRAMRARHPMDGRLCYPAHRAGAGVGLGGADAGGRDDGREAKMTFGHVRDKFPRLTLSWPGLSGALTRHIFSARSSGQIWVLVQNSDNWG